MIAPFLKTMWDHRDGRANQYCCASSIYLLSCLALEFSIIIDISLGAHGHEKYVFDGLNAIEKQMLKLAMVKLLNPESIRDDLNIFKFMQVHKNEEYPDVSLEK